MFLSSLHRGFLLIPLASLVHCAQVQNGASTPNAQTPQADGNLSMREAIERARQTDDWVYYENGTKKLRAESWRLVVTVYDPNKNDYVPIRQRIIAPGLEDEYETEYIEMIRAVSPFGAGDISWIEQKQQEYQGDTFRGKVSETSPSGLKYRFEKEPSLALANVGPEVVAPVYQAPAATYSQPAPTYRPADSMPLMPSPPPPISRPSRDASAFGIQ